MAHIVPTCSGPRAWELVVGAQTPNPTNQRWACFEKFLNSSQRVADLVPLNRV